MPNTKVGKIKSLNKIHSKSINLIIHNQIQLKSFKPQQILNKLERQLGIYLSGSHIGELKSFGRK